jgi:GNAT superfamily N-acetyltransferase
MSSDHDAQTRVRRLADADQARWRELWAGYLAFYRAQLADELTAATFARLCEGRDGMLGLVAVDAGDRPLGLAHLVFHAATWHAGPVCYLEDLYVEPAARGSTAARALLEASFAAARERGAEQVYWHTQQFNGAARSLYDTVARLTSFVVYERELR